MLTTPQPTITQALQRELSRQLSTANFIASENFPSKATLGALSHRISSKYAEGSAFSRYYKGCENADVIEQRCEDSILKLTKWRGSISVQPHAGCNANMAAYFAFLKPGDRVLALGLSQGSHLSHGSSVSATSQIFRFQSFRLVKERLDYNEIEHRVAEYRPRMLVVGFSSYPRDINYDILRQICDRHDVVLHCDVSHTVGLIVSNVMNSPVDFADSVVFTTHKTFRGPRGAVLLVKEGKAVKDAKKAVFPTLQGGPFMNNIAAIANAAEEARTEGFREDCARMQAWARKAGQHLEHTMTENSFQEQPETTQPLLFTGGTDCHYFVLRCRKSAADELERAGIVVSPQKIGKEDGIRVGFPFLVSQGAQDAEIEELNEIMSRILTGQTGSGALYRPDVERVMAGIRKRLEQQGAL